MQNKNERVLKIISNETKEEVCKLDMVTPEIFANIFMQKAKEHKLEDYGDVVVDYIEQQVANYLHIQDETTQTADKLSRTTNKAIEAIEEKNDGALKEVLSETKILKKEIEKLKASLYKDELTGCFNRKWMYDHVIMESTNQFKKAGILGLIDLNYFKLVNDTYGHIIGDKVLIFVATQLKKTKGDVVRYGGDEFLVFFKEHCQTSDALQKLKDLREDLLKKHLKAKEAEFRISFSIGVTAFKKGESLDEVIERADKEMYDDKEAIKQRIKGIDV